MQITPSSLRAINVGYSAVFQQGYTRAQPQAIQLATEVPSQHAEQHYGWMAKLPKMREWIGDRMVHNLATKTYSIANKPFELTIGVDRDDIEDDQLGIYNPAMEEMGYQARMWPDDLITEIIRAGETSTCFDGQFFFDTDHPITPADGSATFTQSNLLSAMPLTADNYFAARAAFRAFKGEDGRKFKVNPNLLVAPPNKEKVALEILQTERLANGQDNVARGTATLLILDDLDDNDWYLFDTRRPIKPFVFQLRKAPEFVARDNPEDSNVFSKKEFQYGVDSRGNAGYSLWFLGMKIKAA
jgi:phage major head subunit gpT-like protein